MPKLQIAPYRNDFVSLRLLRAEDLPLTREWRNQEEIRKWFFHADIISEAQHRAWYNQYCDRENDFVFIIEEIAASNRPIGQVSIYNIDWENRCGEFGRLMIGEPTARGKGLAFAAIFATLQVAYQTLGLGKLTLEVYANNEAAITLYEKAGFIWQAVHDGVVSMVHRGEENIQTP